MEKKIIITQMPSKQFLTTPEFSIDKRSATDAILLQSLLREDYSDLFVDENRASSATSIGASLIFDIETLTAKKYQFCIPGLNLNYTIREEVEGVE